MQRLLLLLLLILPSALLAQTGDCHSCGTFTDGITSLRLRPDSSFELAFIDPVFSYTFQQFNAIGRWTDSAGHVVLNPGMKKRRMDIGLTERVVPGQDSITIRIDYQTAVYEDEVLKEQQPAAFNMMTLYLNKRRHYHHIVHAPVPRPFCGFAPRIKHQYIVDSTNTIRLPPQQVEKIGLYSYGFEKPIELKPMNPAANYFEIRVVQPFDTDRRPRSKTVIVRGNKAFYYEDNGKVVTSGMLNPLRQVNR